MASSTFVTGAAAAYDFAQVLVIYDIVRPSRAWLASLLGRFDRLDRSTKSTVHIVVPLGEFRHQNHEAAETLHEIVVGRPL